MKAKAITESIEVTLSGDSTSELVDDSKNISALIRLAINAENEAVILYQKIADSTDDELVQKVMLDVADEEKVHAGEFLKLLKEIEQDEADFYADGADEVEKVEDTTEQVEPRRQYILWKEVRK